MAILTEMKSRPRVMVVDDESRIRGILREAFEREGLEVLEAGDAETMFRLLARFECDVIALDLGLPGEDGLSVTRRLRGTSDVPIVMITGRGEVVDKVIGLELGADDYVSKPFHIREVVARVRAVIRRRQVAAQRAAPPVEADAAVAFDGWRLDLPRRELRRMSGEEQDLTAAEFELLKYFVTHSNRVLSRDQIMDHLKGRSWSPFDRGVDMQVRRLRMKIEDNPAHPRHIKTVRGAGYLFATKVEAAPAESPAV
jgi:two-component system phosphate regulon response regulator OmpR